MRLQTPTTRDIRSLEQARADAALEATYRRRVSDNVEFRRKHGRSPYRLAFLIKQAD